MVSVLLAQKIFSYLIIFFMGFILVRAGVMEAGQSKVFSVMTMYLAGPCMILSTFNQDFTPSLRSGMLLALVCSVAAKAVFLLMAKVLRKPLKTTVVEEVSAIYSNSFGLILPIISSLLGRDWAIYPLTFFMVQQVLLWSQAKSALSGTHRIEWKKILANTNIIAIFVGMILFVTGLRFPGTIQSAIDSMGNTVGPMCMLTVGMLAGSMDVKNALKQPRLWLAVCLRLVLYPLMLLPVLKYSGISKLHPDGFNIVLITLIAASAPSASTITQMSQVFGGDAEQASAIHILTTICCIFTMPMIIALFQM